MAESKKALEKRIRGELSAKMRKRMERVTIAGAARQATSDAEGALGALAAGVAHGRMGAMDIPFTDKTAPHGLVMGAVAYGIGRAVGNGDIAAIGYGAALGGIALASADMAKQTQAIESE